MAKRMSVSRGIKKTGFGGDTDPFFSDFEAIAIVIGCLLALAFIVVTVFFICKLFSNKKKSTGEIKLKNSSNTTTNISYGKQTTLCALPGKFNKVAPLESARLKQKVEPIEVKPYTSSVEDTLHKLGFTNSNKNIYNNEEDPSEKKQVSDAEPGMDILASPDDQQLKGNKSQTELNALVSSIEYLKTPTNIDQTLFNRERKNTIPSNAADTSLTNNRYSLAPPDNVRYSRSRGSVFNNFFPKDCPDFEDNTTEKKATDTDDTSPDESDQEFINEDGRSERTEKDLVKDAEYVKSRQNKNSGYDHSNYKKTTVEIESKGKGRERLNSESISIVSEKEKPADPDLVAEEQ
ncbi:unnamed protein product [Mytilus coruscus]|uniref:Uncharacterized protein n=1 Tax=Mytilus coruscus TaxID=42192 RepID=A0A6J8BN92_MYTCO|nr:unnamed protein product [Mytilus coruscus]